MKLPHRFGSSGFTSSRVSRVALHLMRSATGACSSMSISSPCSLYAHPVRLLTPVSPSRDLRFGAVAAAAAAAAAALAAAEVAAADGGGVISSCILSCSASASAQHANFVPEKCLLDNSRPLSLSLVVWIRMPSDEVHSISSGKALTGMVTFPSNAKKIRWLNSCCSSIDIKTVLHPGPCCCNKIRRHDRQRS